MNCSDDPFVTRPDQLELFPMVAGLAKQREAAADACDHVLDAFAAITVGDDNWKYAATQLYRADQLLRLRLVDDHER